MLILSFDTSSLAGSVALLDGARLLGESVLDPAKRSAQTLAPAIAELLATHEVKATQIGLVATTTGPGSFTGLRVGVTTAKTFAYAAEAEVLGVSTLEVIALQAAEKLEGLAVGSPIQAVLDAQRRELFLGRFRLEADASGDDELPVLTRLAPDGIVAADAWLAGLEAGTIVSGRGLEKIRERVPADVRMAASESWEPRAAVVGRLAWRDYCAGRREDLWGLMPVYLRLSYADEKVKGPVADAGTRVGPGS